MSSAKSEKKGGITSKIICKYFIQDKCTKGDACPYLHSKVEKPKEILQIECPMYNIGFCKNGRNCHFLHIKKDKYIEEDLDQKNPNSSPNQIKEEEETKEINSTNESNKEEENKFPEIPIWYLEHYYDKPLPLIFSELEQKNLPEINELKKKYGFTNIQPNLPAFPLLNKKNKMNLNMNTLNLNFNNFNMNYAFNNNKTDIIQNSYQVNKMGQDRKYDKYEFKKNNIENLLKKPEKVFYYLIRCKAFEEIKKSQESNFISLPDTLSEKYKNETQNITIILILVDDEFHNFSGFAQLKIPLSKEEKEGEEILYKIEWQWRTKLSLSKISHLKNKIDNDNYLIDGKNGCEIDKDLGFICCRYLMKRLSKDEIKVFMNEKKDFYNEKEDLNQDNNNNNQNININNNSNKDLNKVNKNYEKYKINSPFKNSNANKDMSNTNSTRYSDYKKNEKEIEIKYSGRKRYRDNNKSRSKSKSKDKNKKRRDHSEDYSPYYKNKNSRYENKHYHNSNDYNSNKKLHMNSRNYKDYKDNNLHYRHKHSDYKNDYSSRKYHY